MIDIEYLKVNSHNRLSSGCRGEAADIEHSVLSSRNQLSRPIMGRWSISNVPRSGMVDIVCLSLNSRNRLSSDFRGEMVDIERSVGVVQNIRNRLYSRLLGRDGQFRACGLWAGRMVDTNHLTSNSRDRQYPGPDGRNRVWRGWTISFVNLRQSKSTIL